MSNRDIVEAGKGYLLSCVTNGLCLEFFKLRHGPSVAWTSSCIGSTLSEFKAVPNEMLEAILALQWDCGGWSYNQKTAPDADSTLRVLQFLDKVGFHNNEIIAKAERFVIAHQKTDGGVATYLPEYVADMGYSGEGWVISVPCITALASHVLRNKTARQKARKYLINRLTQGDDRAYWWRTPYYVLYESCYSASPDVDCSDPVEISLCLLLKAKLGVLDQLLLKSLKNLQLTDGSFPASQQFRIPRPHQTLDDLTGREEVVEDNKRIFTTAAAVVAIARQEALRK